MRSNQYELFYGTSVCSEVCTSMMQQLCGVMKAGMETSDENARKFRASCNTTTSSMITILRTGL